MKVTRVGEKAGLDFGAGELPRKVGRVAIWIVIGLLLVRGAGAILSPEDPSAQRERAGGRSVDPAAGALAIGFARAFLSDPSPRALGPFLAEGAQVRRDAQVLGRTLEVVQAEVSATQDLGGGRAILTVACELRDARTLYLAVPISRSLAGEVAVQGAPWIVAEPERAGVAAERPRPLAGPGASAIATLVEKFVPAYVAAREPGDLSYLLAPGASAAPLRGSLELLSLAPAAQLDSEEGPRRTILAAGRFRDTASGSVYRLAYRLELIRRDRWYVAGVAGALS